MAAKHRTTDDQMREHRRAQSAAESHLDFRTYFNSQSLLGGVLVELGRLEKAEPLLLTGMEGLEQREQEMPSNAKRHITSTIERLIQLYELTKRPEEVTRWQARLPNTAAEESVPE